MSANNDPFHLQRFLDAQAPVMARVRDELRGGRKRSHWMWFVFPQVSGLGHSAMARHYAVGSLEEARAYLEHSVLGARYRECVGLAMAIDGRDAHAIFGSPDDLKFHSSLTLFARAAPGEALFAAALARFYGGAMDEATLARLA